eukprot:TRINITY_DN8214_c0_g2_i1.p2 TRINITY_DN8214_c0_g2~~TRINITY_DN8214_c0_g2_i1.p2  ORF type:complete len:218 (+),score=17.78 TRINITY_DN8214_c0_g2_i1:70-654(+)
MSEGGTEQTQKAAVEQQESSDIKGSKEVGDQDSKQAVEEKQTKVTIPTEYKELVEAVRQLYVTKEAKEQIQVLEKWYSPNARFDDNIAVVKNRNGIRLQFHSLIKIFSNVELEVTNFQAETTDKGPLLIINNKQVYSMGKRDIKIEAITKLQLERDYQIITNHQDRWQGYFTNFWPFRRMFGGGLSAAMRLVKV